MQFSYKKSLPFAITLLLGICGYISNALPSGSSVDADGNRTSRISDEVVTQLDLEAMPKRPKPIIELGPKFLGNGNIGRGFELPTGAVWQPALLIFGTYRTAIQSFHSGGEANSEWANRLDLFANLQLSGSERILLGFRPLQQDGRFTSYQFDSANGADNDWNDELNSDITTFFFEGDFGEIFPNLDKEDKRHHDFGFVIGRQPVSYQAGMLINDTIDAIGITRNTLVANRTSDFQVSVLYGWNEIHRGDNVERNDQKLLLLSFAADIPSSTVNLDLIYVNDEDGDTDGFFWGISDVRRIGHFNLSTRILGSHALEEESSAVGDGNLIFGELSWTPPWTDNNIYINLFLGIDNFTSAARDPMFGGALGRNGILFRAIQLGRYGPPLSNRSEKVIGGAWGIQWFLNPVVNQVIFELGLRHDSRFDDTTSVAATARYRHVLSQHMVAQFDIFGAIHENRSNTYGTRFELRIEF